MDAVAGLAPFVVIAALFWFLLIRPAQRRQRQQRDIQQSAAPGAEVVLTSGIFGTVVEENEDATLSLEVAPGTVIKVARGAIGQVIEPAAEPETEPEDQAHETAPTAPASDGQ